MPSEDDDRPTAFPLHNNEPELIDYFVSPLESANQSVSGRNCREAQKNIFKILVKTDAARYQHTVSLFHSVICREAVSKFAPTRTIFLPEC